MRIRRSPRGGLHGGGDGGGAAGRMKPPVIGATSHSHNSGGGGGGGGGYRHTLATAEVASSFSHSSIGGGGYRMTEPGKTYSVAFILLGKDLKCRVWIDSDFCLMQQSPNAWIFFSRV